jgi:hypothetical protein
MTILYCASKLEDGNPAKIKTDNTFLNDLISVENKYIGPNRSFKGAVPPEVEKLIKTYTVGNFDSADAINATRVLKEQGNAAMRSGETAVGKAQLEIAKSLENQIERSLIAQNNPNATAILDQFKASRQRMAVSHAVEDAIHEGAGSVDAKKLASDLQSGKYLTGELETAAKFANTFKNVNRSPSDIGTPGASTLFGLNMRGALGAAFGTAVTGGSPFGGLVGAFAPEAMSAGARNFLLSNAGQKRAIQRYERPLRNALANEPSNNMLLYGTQSLPFTGQ